MSRIAVSARRADPRSNLAHGRPIEQPGLPPRSCFQDIDAGYMLPLNESAHGQKPLTGDYLDLGFAE